MSDETIRAWKDPEYRASMSASGEGAPENPAGKPLDELDDDELDDAAGGSDLPPTVGSGGNVCTLTTECPILSVCCQSAL